MEKKNKKTAPELRAGEEAAGAYDNAAPCITTDPNGSYTGVPKDCGLYEAFNELGYGHELLGAFT